MPVNRRAVIIEEYFLNPDDMITVTNTTSAPAKVTIEYKSYIEEHD